MKTTAAVLRDLQDYYDSLPSRPTIKEVAHLARLPVATTARFLNGTNQSGLPDRVRALCIALDRHDLADALPQTPSFNAFNEVWALFREGDKESRESNLEELERVRTMYEQSEARWEKMIASKDRTIEALTHRITKLENDKENQVFVNKTLLADKAKVEGEMEYVRDAKRKRDAALIIALLVIIALFVAILVYLIKYDLPNPSYGVLR